MYKSKFLFEKDDVIIIKHYSTYNLAVTNCKKFELGQNYIVIDGVDEMIFKLAPLDYRGKTITAQKFKTDLELIKFSTSINLPDGRYEISSESTVDEIYLIK